MRAYQEEDLILQRVLAESLLTSQGGGVGGSGGETSDNLPQIQLASGTTDEPEVNRARIPTAVGGVDVLSRVLEMSKREEEERRRRELEEEEELRRVLELSLLEK